jgi:HD-GYP domain-containing protein (c-di-GMP phosphodiesterase class II)
MPVLRVTTGAQKGKVHDIADENMVMGRESSGEIQVLDQGVSRRHAEIFRIGEMYFIRDLESRNGTFLNDKPVKEDILRVGDQIRLGNTALVFEDKLAALQQTSRVQLDEPSAEEEALLPSSTIQLQLDTIFKPQKATDEKPAGTTDSRDVSLLYLLGQIMGEEKDLTRLLERIATAVGEALECDHLYVLWKQGQGSSFDILGRFDRAEANGSLAGVSRNIIQDCLNYGRSILTSDASMDGQFDGMASVVMNRLRSIICVPIQVLGTQRGVLYLYSRRAEAFSAEDLELASSVGIQLGTTVGLLKSLGNSDRFFRSSIRTLVSAIEMRNPSTHGKAERLGTYCLAIAKELGLPPAELRTAWLAGMLHHIGLAPMTDKELEQTVTLSTRQNSNARKILAQVPDLADVLPALENQNERVDGSGGPSGKKGDEIPLLGRVLGLALTLDEMLSSEEDGSLKDTLLKLKDMADRRFDRQIINALLIAYRNARLFNVDEEFFEVPLD